jgi:very-short-patch-repair endonuclease
LCRLEACVTNENQFHKIDDVKQAPQVPKQELRVQIYVPKHELGSLRKRKYSLSIKKLKPLARTLRKNLTDAERNLWVRIRGKPLKDKQFYRQKNIGNYVVDFYCPSAKLIVEIDGGQHYSEEGKKKDEIRDSYLQYLGFTVLRFSDREVLKNIDGVLERIYEYL